MMQTGTTDYLVIGAGLGGLAFAGDRAEAGAGVRLLDKGRGVGGRAATRRWEDIRLDHGAQYFTAKGERLRRLTDTALTEGWLAVWCHGFPVWREGTITERSPGHPRFSPPGGMSELPKRLAQGLEVTTGATVTALERDSDGVYHAFTENGVHFSGRSLILNLPPVQLLALARPLLQLEMAERVAAVRFDPAWALLLRLEQDIPGASWPAVEFDGHPVLGWVARDHTRRRSGSPPALVVHGSGAWSREHLEASPDAVSRALLAAVEEVFGPLALQDALVHRWRYALPVTPLTASYLWDPERRIGVCGDWCGGPRVEGALESGWSLAAAVSVP